MEKSVFFQKGLLGTWTKEMAPGLTLLSRGGRKWSAGLHRGPLRAWLWPCWEAQSLSQLQPGHWGWRGWYPSPSWGLRGGDHRRRALPVPLPLCEPAPLSPCPLRSSLSFWLFPGHIVPVRKRLGSHGLFVAAGRWKGLFHLTSFFLFILPGVWGEEGTLKISL